MTVRTNSSSSREVSRTTQLPIPVLGLGSEASAESLENLLMEQEGVIDAMVSTEKGRAILSFDPDRVLLARIRSQVEDLGYEVPAEFVRFGVEGMTCTGCSDGIQRALSRMHGVVSADVSLAREEATVKYLEGTTRLEEFESRVKGLGYRAVPLDADAAETAEAPPADRSRAKLITAVACTSVIFLLNMVLPLVLPVPVMLQEWAGLVLAGLVHLWVGSEFHQRAWKSALSGMLGMDVLISLGSNVAYLTGAAVLLLNLDRALFPLFFEAASFIITFVYLGRYLETRTRRRTKEAIRELMTLQPPTARVVSGESSREVPLAEVREGDMLLVRAGDTIPVDGVVSRGASSVNESMLTGESMPIAKEPGDRVWAGTSNLESSFQMSAQAEGADSFVAQISRMVEQSLISRAPVQSLADKISSVFVPAVLGLAAITAVIWGFWGAPGLFPDESPVRISLLFASSVLLISCPCALGLATPTAMIAGTAVAARRGILVKHAAALQQLAGVDALAFDKTGTVTTNRPAVRNIVVDPDCGVTANELLALAASAAEGSAHPMSHAIRDEAARRHTQTEPTEEFLSIAGKGMQARVGGRFTVTGSTSLMEDRGLDLDPWASHLQIARDRGRNLTFTAVDGRICGFFSIEDTLKSQAPDFVKAARAAGVSLHMLSGDSRPAATAISLKLGLDPEREMSCELLPPDKEDRVSKLRAGGQTVCMVGDGINDALALAAADVGVAVSTGHNLALEVADVGLLSHDLRRIPEALGLGRRVMRIVKQNLFWAFFYNVAAIPLAAGLFVPLWGPTVKLSPPVAAVAMTLSSILVVQNSLRLYRSRQA